MLLKIIVAENLRRSREPLAMSYELFCSQLVAFSS